MSSTGFSAGWSGNESSGGTSRQGATRELFFPKPFNLEQIQIIDRLEHSDGVVVQGPPGTGKTHTIANITTEVTTLNLQEVSRQIDRLHSRIGQLHQGIAEIDRELASWAKKNMDEAPGSLGGLKPAEMARAVLEQTSAHEWFPDPLPVARA